MKSGRWIVATVATLAMVHQAMGQVEEAKLTAGDAAAFDAFGASVSLSGDRALIGAMGDGAGAGSAYVYEYDGTNWVEIARLTAGDAAADDRFGTSVSLSGARALVGADQDDTGAGADAGSAYVFSLPPEVPLVSVPDATTLYDRLLTIPVSISEITGAGIVSAEVFISYDASLLTAADPVTTGTLAEDWTLESNVEDDAGTTKILKLAMASETSLAGSGTLVDLSFQVADRRSPASSPLVLTHVLLNDGTPDNATRDGSVTLVGTDGSIASLPSEIIPRWSIGVSVYDADEDRDSDTRDAFAVAVASGDQAETLTVTETGHSTGIFSGVISTAFSLSSTSDDGIVQAQAGDQIVFSYADSLDAAGKTVERMDATDVIGGADGVLRMTVVAQPGDTIRVRVTDADLNTDPAVVEGVRMAATNRRTGERESLFLEEIGLDDEVFFGTVRTAFFVVPNDNDGILAARKGDTLEVAYDDELTSLGGTATVIDHDFVVAPFGDADDNRQTQAFDAAQVLFHRLSTYNGGAGTLSGLDSLSANVDQAAPFGIIDGYDASLILRKVVGLISRFEVQEPDAANHPQPETGLLPKPLPDERVLALLPGEGHISVWCDDREGIVSGELTLAGMQGQAVMGEELRDFLSASREAASGLQVVFAGAEGISGSGELLRIAGAGFGDARLTRASFNGGRIAARWEESGVSVAVPVTFALYPNAPNPFNPETSIRFALARESQVRLDVFDVLGQPVRVLVTERLSAGVHQVVWNGRGENGERASSGVYFCRLQARHAEGEFSQVQRMLLLK